MKKIIYPNNRKIIFFPKYGNSSPSFRVRFKSYIPYLEKNSYKVITKVLFNNKFYTERIFLKKTNYLKSLYYYFRRLYYILFYRKPFIAVIHIELLPYIPYLGEFILKIRKIPYIVDIDDAVYLRFHNKNFILNYLLNIKFNYMIKNASSIFAGNKFHFNNFKILNKNIHYFPSVIDFNKYEKFINNTKHKNFTIVWIGTPSTSIYLLDIVDELNFLIDKHGIDLKLIGADKNLLSNLKGKFIDWSEKNELSELSKCHVGIMPLRNTKWERGKCAYKILQYMALKLAVVASPIGVNKEIIVEGKNGFLANNQKDWSLKIIELKKNEKLFNKVSSEGHLTSKNNFNIENYKILYRDILNKIK